MVDEEYLIIIDESQYLRNRENQDGERHSFRQLRQVRQTGCRILLLTATPYSVDLEDVNHQLSLLPQTGPGQKGMLSLHEDYHSWKINNLEGLRELEVASVLNTPTVASIFGKVDPETQAEYVLYPDNSRMYFPSVRLMSITTPVVAEEEIAQLLESGLFQHQAIPVHRRGEWSHLTRLAETQISLAWGSSPWALEETLQEVLGGGYNYAYSSPSELRDTAVQRALQNIRALDHRSDPKFLLLHKLVEMHLEEQKKVLIFCERLSTVAYLGYSLRQVLSKKAAQRVASTVRYSPGNRRDWPIYSNSEVEAMIRGFAPLANQRDHEVRPPDDLYDIFVTSDRLAAGINLQDATVQISYDLAWGADTIYQRAGRIMRLRPAPARITLSTFIPNSQRALQLLWRTGSLKKRTAETASLTLLNPLSGSEEEIAQLSALVGAPVTLRTLLPQDLQEELLHESSPFLTDLHVYHSHPDYHDPGEDFGSIMVREQLSERLLYSLIRYQEKVIPLLFKPASGHLEEATPDQVLGYLRCEPDTPVAQIRPDELERERSRCIRQWCAQHGIDESQVAHICSMLLVGPHSETELLGT